MSKRITTPGSKTPIDVAGISSAIFQIASDAIIVIDEAQNIVFFNQGAEKIFMYEAAEVTGKALELLLPDAFHKTHRAEVEKFADARVPARLKDQRRKIAGRRKNGEVFPGEASITRIVFDGKTYFAAFFRDITEKERREKQVGLQLAMTRAIAEADCFESALSVSLQMVCEITGWDFGEVWLPAPGGQRLQAGSSYCRPDQDLENFRELSRDFKFEMNVGLPGQVWATRKPVWIPDVTVDANFPRAPHARAAGLRAAAGIPILAGERVVAVLDFFLRAERREDENFVALVSSVAAELGAVFARRQAENALRVQEARFRALIENASDAIALISADGTILYESSGVAHVLGYAVGERTGQTFFELIHPDDQPDVNNRFAQLLQQPGLTISTQLRYRHKDGSWRWLEATGQNLLAEPGVQAIVANYRDITERKHADDLLRESEEKFRTLFEQASDGIFVSDQQGNYLDVNSAGCALLGYTREQLVQMNIRDIVPADEIAHAPLRFDELFSGKTVRSERQLQRKDGSRVPVEISAHMLPDGRLQGFLRDITERRKAEEEIRLLLTITQAVGEAADFPSALTASLQSVCQAGDWAYGEAWIPRSDGDSLILGSAWYGNGEATAKFKEMSAGISFAPGIGLPGRVWSSKRPEWIRDVSVNGEVFLRASQALEVGLRAGLGVPILANGQVLAVLVFFMPAARETDARLVEIISAVAAQLGAVFQHKQTEEALRKSEAALNRAQEVGRVGSWEFDLRQNSATWSAETYRLYSVPPGTIPTYEIFLACVHPEDRDLVDRSWKAALSGAPYDIEYRVVVGGEVRWLQARTDLEYDASGAPLRGVGMAQDITERKRAEKILRQRLTELELLYESSLAVSQLLQPKEIAQRIIGLLARKLHWHHTTIRLYHPQDETLELLAFNQPGIRSEEEKNALEERFNTIISKKGQGLSGWVVEHGQAACVGDLARDARYAETFPGLQSGLYVPIKIAERVIGVVSIESEKAEMFSESDERLVTALAAQVASALENARLFENTQRHLRRTLALREIDQAIAGSMHLKQVIEIVLKHIITELGVDAAVILLHDVPEQVLKYELGTGLQTNALQFTRLRLGEGYAGRAALGRQTVHIPDLQTHTTDFLRSPTFSLEGFICYFGVPLIAKDEIKGVLEIFHRSPLDPDKEWLDFMETLAGQVAIAIDNATLYKSLQLSNIELSMAYDSTIEGWSRALDLRDKETEGHTQRVTELTERLARTMGISEAGMIHVRRGALLHDIGKMGVPDGILFKPNKLTDEEWTLMKKHPQFAYDMLSPIDYLKPALDIPYCHHEKWDGTGYPRGLKGEQIPLAARIFAMADVWDALTSDRPYRKAWSKEKTLEYIRQQSRKHFDPQLVEVFLAIVGNPEEHKP